MAGPPAKGAKFVTRSGPTEPDDVHGPTRRRLAIAAGVAGGAFLVMIASSLAARAAGRPDLARLAAGAFPVGVATAGMGVTLSLVARRVRAPMLAPLATGLALWVAEAVAVVEAHKTVPESSMGTSLVGLWIVLFPLFLPHRRVAWLATLAASAGPLAAAFAAAFGRPLGSFAATVYFLSPAMPPRSSPRSSIAPSAAPSARRRRSAATAWSSGSAAAAWASTEVTREDFRDFARPPLRRYPEIAALEWFPVVAGRDRAAVEAKARAEGFPRYAVRELGPAGRMIPAAECAAYLPMLYMEPPNEVALGLDLLPDSGRRRPADEARDRGAVVVSPRMVLVEDPPDVYSVAIQHLDVTPEKPSYWLGPAGARGAGDAHHDLPEKDRERRPATAMELQRSLLALVDLPGWTDADAETWWAERRAEKPKPTTPTQGELTVDLDHRGPSLG